MTNQTFQPGFRLSITDVAILVVGAGVAASLASASPWLAWATAFVVLHFFLFCNVVRMSRPLELLWAGVFLCLAASASTLQVLAWPVVFGIAATLTVVLTLCELRKPSYHGVGWRRVNPRLEDWWRGRTRE